MATETGRITATLTKVGAITNYAGSTSTMTLVGSANSFIDGSTALKGYSHTSTEYAVFYGFNFESLRDLPNLKIKGFTFSLYCGRYSSSSSLAPKSRVYLQLVSDFNTSGTDATTFTAVSNKYTLSSGSVAASSNNVIKTQEDMPEALIWMNDNIDKVLNGYTTNSFGIVLGLDYAQVKTGLTLTLEYEYGEPEYHTVTTSVSPTGTGTVTPTHQVEEGSTTTVSAIPNAGYKFSHWLVNGVNNGVTSTTLSFTVTANTTVTAVFVLDKINKIYVGTSQPKAIYVGTQEVKEIYVGTTKVYG